ncbi:hypothetical protein HK16_08390 [Acetobacter senegalensis]|uniref:Uncharacterized protein n=2 Tax=Acetobacter TaxID=434 RepID=A0A252EJR2_9PROT|nr:hypothetical protein [Acetobacter tropicalis]ATJ90218.1 hypothetical protein CIW82_05445 [Acetobacter tropicalis]OUL66677.1 hypothetical protein HK16_08390 [Acetobacter senegalensis]
MRNIPDAKFIVAIGILPQITYLSALHVNLLSRYDYAPARRTLLAGNSVPAACCVPLRCLPTAAPDREAAPPAFRSMTRVDGLSHYVLWQILGRKASLLAADGDISSTRYFGKNSSFKMVMLSVM